MLWPTSLTVVLCVCSVSTPLGWHLWQWQQTRYPDIMVAAEMTLSGPVITWIMHCLPSMIIKMICLMSTSRGCVFARRHRHHRRLRDRMRKYAIHISWSLTNVSTSCHVATVSKMRPMYCY